ncbi:hypothetical protein D3C71_689280 [compost metagenome]
MELNPFGPTHTKDPVPEAVKFNVCPTHKGPLFEAVIAGSGVTVMLIGADVVEQAPIEAVTVYAPPVVTVIAWVVPPFDQVFPVVADDVKTTEPPAQNVVGPPAVIVGTAGSGFTVTVVATDVAEQTPFETVTVYVPLAVTVIIWVVAPFDQVFPVAEDEVRITEPPVQKVVGPLAVIVGVVGSGFTVTVVATDVEEQGPFETVTV